jgi:dTDP-glucose pyrophosphorylase
MDALVQLNLLAMDAVLFVVDDEGRLKGSLTDGDVRRALIRGVAVDNIVDDIIMAQPRFLRKEAYDIETVIEYRNNNFKIIPIVDADFRIINVINFRVIKSYLPVDVVVMAGGRGQRLKPLTDTVPKPMLKVGDKPIIEHTVERLASYGIRNFWISVNYLAEQIEAHFGDGAEFGLEIKYVKEHTPLGTLGSVSLIRDFVHDYVLVTNSDVLTNLDYEHFFLEFIKSGAELAVATIPYHVDIPYAVLETANGHVVDFKEKPTYTYYSNGGIYLIKREILDLLPYNEFYNATDLMEHLLSGTHKVISYPLNNYWLDIGRPEDFERAQKDIYQIKF